MHSLNKLMLLIHFVILHVISHFRISNNLHLFIIYNDELEVEV